MKVRWLSFAETDFSRALDHYLIYEQSPQAAADLADEVDHAIKAISSSPNTFPKFEEEVRVKLIRRYPYSILYLIEDDEIIILSMIHQEREPGYWKERL